MTDRELLEMAAKAAGYEVAREADNADDLLLVGVQEIWNPLTDDGDALRLAVKLKFSIYRSHCTCCIGVSDHDRVDWLEKIEGDERAVTRRAIVHAAAELGR